MQAVTAIFHELQPALRAAQRLRASIPRDRMNLLTPASSEAEIHGIPHDEDMPPVAKKMGAILGGALGAGLALALLPGVGPVLAGGAAFAALLGAGGGTAAGWAVGSALDRHASHGIPVDELYFYEDALRKGHTVIVVMVDGENEEELVRGIFDEEGAESIDQARQSWWIGLRDADEVEFAEAREPASAELQMAYRAGFEAAHAPPTRGREYEEACDYLRAAYPQTYASAAFRQGFEHGRARFEAAHADEPRARG